MSSGLKNEKLRVKDFSVGKYDLSLLPKNCKKDKKLRARGEIVECKNGKNFLVNSGKKRKMSFSGETIVVEKHRKL